MSEYRYAQLAARLLRAARGRIGPHPSAPPGDVVVVLASSIRRTAARRSRRRIAKSVGAVGIVLILGWALTRPRGPTATGQTADLRAHPKQTFVVEGTVVATVTTSGGPAEPLLPGQEWRSGERLRTDGHAITLATGDDTAIEVDPHTDLRLERADAERWLRLGSGSVEVHVAKLKVDERFVIATPDAEVEVRGTRFRVAVVPAIEGCGRGSVTRVSVTEGVVVVRSSGQESRVRAGDQWPAGCADHPGSAAPAPAPDLAAAPKKHLSVSPLGSPIRDSRSNEAAISTLATENDLFGAALKAASAGDRREAVQLLDVLLARFPASPLKESAIRERSRLVGLTQPRP